MWLTPYPICAMCMIQDYHLLVLQEGEIRLVLVFCLYVHLRNSREGKSTSGVGNPNAPHPLNKSLHDYMCACCSSFVN